jgi:hypothetical protein
VPNPSRKERVNDLIYCLERAQIRVFPRRLRVTNLLDDEANEIATETLTNVRGEILDPWKDLCPVLDSREGKGWEWGLLELNYRVVSL